MAIELSPAGGVAPKPPVPDRFVPTRFGYAYHRQSGLKMFISTVINATKTARCCDASVYCEVPTDQAWLYPSVTYAWYSWSDLEYAEFGDPSTR